MTAELRAKIRRHFRNTIAVLAMLVVVVILLPSRARSQLGLDPCCAIISAGLSTISHLLSGAVATPLGDIQQLEQNNVNFEQQVIFPLAAINQARAFAVQAQGQRA